MANGTLKALDDSDPTVLDVEPSEYDDSPAERRASYHQTDGGAVVVQDFGVAPGDQVLVVRSQWAEAATVAALLTKYHTAGVAWLWDDHHGNHYRVAFAGFRHERIRGHEAEEVELRLRVLEQL